MTFSHNLGQDRSVGHRPQSCRSKAASNQIEHSRDTQCDGQAAATAAPLFPLRTLQRDVRRVKEMPRGDSASASTRLHTRAFPSLRRVSPCLDSAPDSEFGRSRGAGWSAVP